VALIVVEASTSTAKQDSKKALTFQEFLGNRNPKDEDLSFGSVKNKKKRERLEGCKPSSSKKAKKDELVKVRLSL
jgi:hypothetical protein